MLEAVLILALLVVAFTVMCLAAAIVEATRVVKTAPWVRPVLERHQAQWLPLCITGTMSHRFMPPDTRIENISSDGPEHEKAA